MIPLVVGLAPSVPVAGALRHLRPPKIQSEIASCAGECVQRAWCPVGKPQPKIIYLSPLPELQCSTPCLAVGPVVGYWCRLLEAPCGSSPNTGVVDKVRDAQVFLIAIPESSAVPD